MAVPPDIRDHAYRLFTQEVPDLLQAIESDLLTLAQERSPAKVHNLMRVAHSIKGGAASVGLEIVASLAHRLENIFKALYSDELEIDTQLESYLLQAYDCLRLPLMQQVVTGEFDAEHALVAAEPAFARVEELLGDVLKQIDHYDIPTSAQLGVDMTLSILEIDVSEQLERLNAVIATAEAERVDAELRSQIEVLIELAEILNKPGLGVMAEVVLSAINANPQQVLQIAPLALTNFQDYREALLASKGKQEITPCEGLLAWIEHPPQAIEPDLEQDLGQDLGQDPKQDAGESNQHLNQNQGGESKASATWTPSDLTSPPTSPPFVAATESIAVSEARTDAPAVKDLASEISLRALLDSIDTEFNPVLESEPARCNALSQPLESATGMPNQQSQTVETLSAEPLPKVSAQIHSEEIPIAPQVTTRVDAEQLEQMNNLVNEAVIKRSSLSLQNEQIQKTVRDLLNRFAAVEQLVAQLRKVSDRTLIPNSLSGHNSSAGRTGPSTGLLTPPGHFDALELDHYGTLHSLLQQFLEDMIHLRESADDIALFARRSNKSLTELRKSLNHLQDDFMWVRMLPIGEVLNRFPRMLRDMSIAYEKPVKLELSGTEVLVDRAVIERIYDPLLHLVRNAFDHGIERPEIRRQRGKPEQGLIEIKACHRGGQTIIEVKDDGEGLNLERIGQRAIEMEILSPRQLAAIGDDRLFNLIFEPGFSTASQVSELSGRGVGLDVVRTQLSHLKGTISVTSQPGVGTTFTLRLPLTLTSDKLLICLAGFTTLALPSDSIHEIFVPRADQVITVGEQKFLHWRKEVFPIYGLSNLLEYQGATPEPPLLDTLVTKAASGLKLSSAPEIKTLIVIGWRQKFAALEVDQLITEQKLVIKPFGAMIAPPNCIYGCTILGDGSVVPVVHGATLIDEALERNDRRRGLPAISLPSSDVTVSPREMVFPHHLSDRAIPYSTPFSMRSSAKILVIDDAVALRQTLALTLEGAGYRVLQAGDGWEGIQQLQFNPDTALVISDIEMPNMNGFDFMNYRRQDPALEKIPLVILTSRSNDKHRRLAMHLGATSYFTKPYIEKTLLQEIHHIVTYHNSL
jgi:chemotaxis family two-component system sensor histidine kinase/response regulator PixL